MLLLTRLSLLRPWRPKAMVLSRNIRPPFPAMLMLGAVSQLAQVLFLRELLMVFHGNELSIGIILVGLDRRRQPEKATGAV